MRAALSLRRSLFPPFLLVFLLAVANWFVAASLAGQWAEDPNYAHGFFVIVSPMAVALVWRRRERWSAAPSLPDGRGLLLLAVAGALYVAGVLAAELFTMRVSLVVAIAGLVYTLEGPRRFRAMLFPIVFLLAMVPIPYVFYYRLTFPLQLESSRLAAAILSGIGMPLVREGNIIHLEGYSLEVVAACSGLRSVMTLGTLALFLLDFLRLAPWLRVVFLVLVIPIAVLANVTRLVITAGIAAIEGPAAAESFLHELSGIVVFVGGLVSIAACGKGLEWIGRTRKS
jgi:exosortase